MRTRLCDRGGELRGPHSAPHGISNYDNKTTKNDNKTDKGYEWSKNFLSDPEHGTMKLFDLKNTITIALYGDLGVKVYCQISTEPLILIKGEATAP